MRREIGNDNRKAKTQWYKPEKGWFVLFHFTRLWLGVSVDPYTSTKVRLVLLKVEQ